MIIDEISKSNLIWFSFLKIFAPACNSIKVHKIRIDQRKMQW